MALPLISVVVPVYGCSECLAILHERLGAALGAMPVDYEIILVNDASPDESWGLIRSLCAADPRVKGVSLSRNFGQHHAICAGLDHARGDFAVVMDCDLQDDPAEIPRLYAKAQEGYDSVLGCRSQRQDSWIKRRSSELFYRALGVLTASKLDSQVANFGIYRRCVVDAVRAMGDKIRFFPLMVGWVGFRSCKLEVRHAERHAGKSSYSWLLLLRLAANVAMSFSNVPLKIIVSAGFGVSGVALVYASYVLALKFLHGISIPGWSSVIISLWFLSGVQMVVAGIVGIYVGKIFDASKDRPVYLVSETLNLRAAADSGEARA